MIDAQANWKSLKPIGPNSMNNLKPDANDLDANKFNKVMSPGSTSLPSWDNLQAMSPYNMNMDMNTIASGSMMGQQK